MAIGIEGIKIQIISNDDAILNDDYYINLPKLSFIGKINSFSAYNLKTFTIVADGVQSVVSYQNEGLLKEFHSKLIELKKDHIQLSKLEFNKKYSR